jgi:hypothetical protein
MTHICGHKALKWEHFMPCFKPAWDKGFTVERNLKGWRIEGLIPFNRNSLWKKIGAGDSLSLRTSTGHSVVSADTPSADLAANTLTPAAVEVLPTPEDLAAAPLAIGAITERVQEAMHFIKANKLRFDDAQLTVEHIVAHSIRLQESSDIVADFLAANAEKPKADKSRITAKTMFGLKGSATGEEGRRMAQLRNEEIMAEKAGKAERKEITKQKKATEVAALVTRGADILRALERHGPRHIASLVIADILALLTNADPQGNVNKPKNKTEGLERVRALGSVQAALTRHALAIAVEQPGRVADPVFIAAPRPFPVELPPLPPFPENEAYIEHFRASLGSFGSSGAPVQPLGPVGPEAP